MTNEPSSHEEFDYENMEVQVREPRASTVYSVRFSRAEIGQIRAAAASVHQTTSEFIRRSALKEATNHVRIYFQAFEGRSLLASRTDHGALPAVHFRGSLARYAEPQVLTHSV